VASGGTIGRSWHDHVADLAVGHRDQGPAAARGWASGDYRRTHTGWTTPPAGPPPCPGPSHPPIPCTVLAPFAGSGTVGQVAEQLGRRSILIELSAPYVLMDTDRTRQRGLFTQPLSAAHVCRTPIDSRPGSAQSTCGVPGTPAHPASSAWTPARGGACDGEPR